MSSLMLTDSCFHTDRCHTGFQFNHRVVNFFKEKKAPETLNNITLKSLASVCSQQERSSCYFKQTEELGLFKAFHLSPFVRPSFSAGGICYKYSVTVTPQRAPTCTYHVNPEDPIALGTVPIYNKRQPMFGQA